MRPRARGVIPPQAVGGVCAVVRMTQRQLQRVARGAGVYCSEPAAVLPAPKPWEPKRVGSSSARNPTLTGGCAYAAPWPHRNRSAVTFVCGKGCRGFVPGEVGGAWWCGWHSVRQSRCVRSTRSVRLRAPSAIPMLATVPIWASTTGQWTKQCGKRVELGEKDVSLKNARTSLAPEQPLPLAPGHLCWCVEASE